MTRFWITLNQSANLILNSFINSQGGEIIIPKIPSVKILDITNSINKKKKIKDEQLSVPKMFAKKYIYYYYAFFWFLLIMVLLLK